MYSLSRYRIELFRHIDDKTKWAVARAYRAERRKGESDYPARLAAFAALGERFPDLTDDQVQAAVAIIIVRAARDHKKWFYDGVGGKPFKPTM